MRMCPETETLPAVRREPDHTQALEIVDARRALIAELEQRRRLPSDYGQGAR
jgi:hypothetical protein